MNPALVVPAAAAEAASVLVFVILEAMVIIRAIAAVNGAGGLGSN